MTPDEYCRELESYLCRKNDGHLVRIVGPGFDRVRQWAEQGVPIAVARAGIDRYFERYYRRGPRRRPVRIEFCEADVLDAFDAWRRAVGVAQVQDTPPRRRPSLAAHVERAIAQLTALRASGHAVRLPDAALERAVRALDLLHERARGARGAAREALIAELAALDRELIDAAMASLDAAANAEAEREAMEQLEPFRERMTPEAFRQAADAARERHVRERCHLPALMPE